MYEIDSLKKFLESVVKIETERVGRFSMLAGQAEYALKNTIPAAEKEVEMLNRFMAALEDFELCPNISWKTGNIENDRELKLLELLKTERYRSEREELKAKIEATLSEIEDDTWDREREEAEEALKSAGFIFVERDDFEGWERGEDRISIESKYEGPHTARNWKGYTFTLEQRGKAPLIGGSGTFSSLLESIKQPATCADQPYTDGLEHGKGKSTGVSE